MGLNDNIISPAQTGDTNKPKTYEFDNSAKFYPIIASDKSQSLFCVGAVLNDEVNPELLRIAANQAIKRYPSLAVSIEEGKKWHYLLENNRAVKIFKAEERIIRPIDTKETNGYWFRISYVLNRIRIDMFHGLCDGTACVRFLKTIVMRYRELQGIVFPADCGIDRVDEPPIDGETEDSFLRYYTKTKFSDVDLKTLKGGVPMRLNGTPIGDTGYINIEGTASVTDIKMRAKAMGVTLTAYITGVLAMTLQEIASSKKPVVLMIPVNLRTVFPSVTMRNFVTFVRIVINPAKCGSLAEYCKEAGRQLTEKSEKEALRQFICTTVRVQNNFIVKHLPLKVKSFFINTGRAALRSRQTIIYSNVGIIKLPEEMGVKKITINMNVSRFNPQNVGSVTVGDRISFNFTRAVKENVLPETFFKKLQEFGIDISQEYEGCEFEN